MAGTVADCEVRLLRNRRRDDRGPIFHARNLRTERSWRKYIMRHACPATWPGKTIWAEVYYGFAAEKRKKCDPDHRSSVDTAAISVPIRAIPLLRRHHPCKRPYYYPMRRLIRLALTLRRSTIDYALFPSSWLLVLPCSAGRSSSSTVPAQANNQPRSCASQPGRHPRHSAH